MNKARLQWHQEKQRSTSEYIRRKNNQSMLEWIEDWADVDRINPSDLIAAGRKRGEQGMRLIEASQWLDGERREGALKRAKRLLDTEHSLFERARRILAGDKPLDEWSICACGGAFQPGERGYTQCWGCSSKNWFATSLSCVYCDRRHSMSFPVCFSCRVHDGRSEENARFLRLMINRRDNYTCAMCGVDAMETGAELQVDHIIPVDLGGTSDPWNLQTLCGTCDAVKGKNYDIHDEREFWKMVRAYSEQLFDYLNADEKHRLLSLDPGDEGDVQIDFGRGKTWPDLGVTTCDEGMLNVLTIIDGKPISV